MDNETTPNESASEPAGVQPTGGTHTPLPGNPSLRSMTDGAVTQVSDTPLPLRAVDPPLTKVVADFGGSIEINAAVATPTPSEGAFVISGGPPPGVVAEAGNLGTPAAKTTLEGASATAEAGNFEISTATGTAAGRGTAAAVGKAIATESIDAVVQPPTTEMLWEVVRAQQALLQATIEATTNRPRFIGPKHNGGPDLAPNGTQDLLWANSFIDLLSDDGPRSKREIEILIATANDAIAKAEKGRSALNAFGLGVVKGAGVAVGNSVIKELIETGWWTAFYARLAEFASAVLDLATSLIG